MLDAYKELTPVVYGENAVKHLYAECETPGKLCFFMHWHDRMELLCVIKGSLELHVEERQFTLREGQIAVFGPQQMHGGFAGSEGVVYHTIMFDVEKFCNGTIAAEKYLVPLCQKKLGFQQNIEDERLRKCVYRLVETLADREEENPLLSVSIIYEMLGILYRYRDQSARVIHRQNKGFGEILEYVNACYTQKISPREISLKFGYNEAYFCRRFREITGLTFTRYIQALRMEHAQKLLQNTKYEIGIVAWECGYEDVSYFSNCFKKHFGYRPTELRGRGKQELAE